MPGCCPNFLVQASKDVEGSTFLVQRTTAPFYQLLVLNKKSTSAPLLLS